MPILPKSEISRLQPSSVAVQPGLCGTRSKNPRTGFLIMRLILCFIFQLFLLPNFNLENPDTFNAVFPWTQVEESKNTQPGTRHSSKLLQEKVAV